MDFALGAFGCLFVASVVALALCGMAAVAEMMAAVSTRRKSRNK